MASGILIFRRMLPSASLALLCAMLGSTTENLKGAESQPKESSTTNNSLMLVWSGAKPVGQTWAKVGPKGSFKVVPQAGMEKDAGLLLHMAGEGFRGAGLNWKGWFPPDAASDASRHTALVFYIRQATRVPNADLTVHLVDNVKRKEGATASNGVDIVAEGCIEKIDDTWRRAVVPLHRFTQGATVQLMRLWEIDFSNFGKDELIFHIDRIGFSNEKVPSPRFQGQASFQAKAQVFPDKKLHKISDGIYGVCGLPREKLIEYGIPLTRWGGNPATRYNWKLGVDNGASDWFFRNRGKVLERLSDSGYLKHIESNQVFGATTYQTVPMIGWVAKDATSYAYSVAKYGPQKATEPGNPDVGNGVYADGGPIVSNDPRDTSIEAPAEFVEAAVRFVVKQAGKADGSDGVPGVKYWALDNEPMIWNATHRDVHPQPTSYEELWRRTVQYAEAIKRADPTARVAGFCSWGWTDLYYSGLDAGKDNYRTRADWISHGKVGLAEWFIKKCGEYRKTHGKPLVDVFDFHWYPQGQVQGHGVYMGKGLNPELNALRMRSTRDLWDPKYEQESWIRNTDNYTPVALLPRVRKWIDEHNPGMELCLGEYNFGGADNITGSLSQAEVFGILGRERLDLAFIWFSPQGSQDLGWRLFRSYDGKKGRFGDEFVECRSAAPDVSVFASRRTSDRAVTIALINKNLHSPCNMSLDIGALKGTLRMWRFDQDSLEEVKEAPKPVMASSGHIELTLPAASASMLIVTPR